MAKFCGKCGTKLDEKTGLCPKCEAEKGLGGKKVKGSKTSRGKKKKRILLIIIAVLVLTGALAAGAIIYFYMSDSTMASGILKKMGINKNVVEVESNLPETDMEGLSYYTSSEENIVQDPEEGCTYINNEILVTLESKEHRTELENYLSTINGQIVGEITELADYQILLGNTFSCTDIKKIAEQLEQLDWVKHASPNYAVKLDAQYVPNDSKWKNKWEDIPDGINWGLEAIDAPAAWEYKDSMQTVNIGVFDLMFDTNHEDLHFAEKPLGNTTANNAVFKGNLEWNDHGTHVAGTMAASFDNKKGIAGVSVKHNLYGVSCRGLESAGYISVQGWKIAFAYLIEQKKCSVVNVSLGFDLLEFNASRECEYALNELKEWTDELGEFLQILLNRGNKFVICTAAGNQNEVGGGYKYFLKDTEDSYVYEYLSYSDFLKYLEGEGNEDDEKTFSRYKNREQEIEECLVSGNVDAKFGVLSGITNEEVKKHIIVVGAVKNLGTYKEGAFLGLGGRKVHKGYQIAAFSQCGERVDVLAPGVKIYSTVKNGYEDQYEVDGGTAFWGGTSMASPHVAGVAAMIFSVNPGIKGEKVREIIKNSSVGKYGQEGYGMLNAGNAVEMAEKEKSSEMSLDNQSRTDKKASVERDIVLTLDVSGSMEGTPINETRKASAKFVNTVLEKDAGIGIVAYNNEAEQMSGFSENKSKLQNVISDLYSDGGTNIEEGLKNAQSMLDRSSAKKKIIVLMSDGEPNDGKLGEELIAYANEIKKSGVLIYTIGFFEDLGEKSDAQYLMEKIASEGCHYEVASADELVFFFQDMADQINGQKYVYVRIACPVDVSVTYDGQTLDSAEDSMNLRTDFGTLTFEENGDIDSEESDDRIKVLRLKEGVDYDLDIVGTGHGIMNYTIGFMDDEGDYNDLRRFENIKITRRTKIDTVAEVSPESILNIDEDGDGKYDRKLRAGVNGYGEEQKIPTWVIYAITAAGILIFIDIVAIIVFAKQKKKRRAVY